VGEASELSAGQEVSWSFLFDMQLTSFYIQLICSGITKGLEGRYNQRSYFGKGGRK
jgi:hypothetical protein